MNALRLFLDYTEPRTKITSVLSFLTALAYLFYSRVRIDPLKSAVFFAGMLLFDLTATTINNTCDAVRAGRPPGPGRGAAKAVTLILLALSTALGFWLFLLTDILVLLAGALCFAFGVAYSFGPAPISHGPYGEAVSGFFYGFAVPALLFYINMTSGFFSVDLSGGILMLRLSLVPAAGLLFVAAVPFCLTAGVMLANNICDLRQDEAAGRYTLPHYLKGYALPLFFALNTLPYLFVAAAAALGFFPPLVLFSFLTVPFVFRNVRRFHKRQAKEETFKVSIQNFLLISAPLAALIFLGGLAGR